jgi:hypothetical protein
MEAQSIRYGGHEIVVTKQNGGWQARIGDTGQSTMIFSSASGALEEAKRLIDAGVIPRR